MKMSVLISLGSARESAPPSPGRVGLRVALYLKALIESEGHSESAPASQLFQ